MTALRRAWRAGWAVAALGLAPGAAAADPGYCGELIQRAEDLRLHEDPYWRILLHYRDGFAGGPVSRIDDPAFFCAPDGKTNPRAELAATLAAFFAPAAANAGDHPVCRFVARFHWLSKQLEIDPEQLPVPACEPFRQVRDHLDIASATLVFPSAYLNTPASMFGHTLLVFDSRDHNRLLARAVNYAALTRESFGPFFAVAGIFGAYPGYYSIEKYYDKVEQYNDINHRDMWEYELDFTRDELARILRHTWELQNISSRYYFFQENCSFNLLYLLDAGRPALRLTDEFRFWVIPIDTVKAVARRGVIRRVGYRPSQASILRDLVARTEDAQQALAHAVAHGRAPAGAIADRYPDGDERRLALDLAAEYAQYLYTREDIPPEAYRTRVLDILRLRSRQGRSPEPEAVPVPAHPEDGHAPARIGLGGGVADGAGFLSLRLRLAYHERIDNPTGFEPGTQIQFGSAEARFDGQREAWKLQRLDLVDVVSLSPRNRFFRPTSWSVQAGLEQFGAGGGDDRLAGVVSSRSGYAYATGDRGLLALTLALDGRVGGGLEDGYRMGAGPAVEWTAAGGPRHSAVARADATWFGLGGDLWRYRASWRQQLFAGVNRGLLLELSHETLGADHRQQVALILNLYF